MSPDPKQRFGAELAQAAVRQLIRETFNVHRPDGTPDILLVGSRRSGSTLLMQAIGVNGGIKWVNQPFSPFSGPPHQKTFLPEGRQGQYFALSDREKGQIVNYTKLILVGHICMDEPWRIYKNDFHFRSKRVVLKTTNAHYLEKVLTDHFALNVVRFLRHPVSQSLSCLRNEWAHSLETFAQSNAFQEATLTEKQRDLFGRVYRDERPIEQHILNWCCENLPILLSLGQHPTMLYENMVVRQDEAIQWLSGQLGLANYRRMAQVLRKPSYSTRKHSTTSSKVAVTKGDSAALLERWRHSLSAEELQKA